jgi:flagellar biosynthesis/type III secretory pathway protein FliH
MKSKEVEIQESYELIAEEHAEFLARIIKWAYKEGFLHGAKHGKEDVPKKYNVKVGT